MTTIKAQGRLLAAATENRTLRYLLLPYGEPGRTSAGLITASAGTVAIPESITANLEHDRTRPVARSTSLTETDQGIEAEFLVSNTTAGNDLLVEAADGLRTGVSVEIENPVIRGGNLLAGDLVGAGFVTDPAFHSAQLITAADCGDLDPSVSPDAASSDPVSVTAEASSPTAPAAGSPTESETTVDENATAPVELLSAASKNAAGKPDKDMSKNDLIRLVAKAYSAGRPDLLTAALTDINQSVFDDARLPQYLGEIAIERTEPQFYVPLVSQASLTARKAVGWKWATKPTVGDYAGFPNEIHSSGMTIEPVEYTAEMQSAGASFDRSIIDFNETAFIDAYFRFCNEDLAVQTDAKVLAKIYAASTAVTGGAVPDGVSPAVAKIVDGYLAVLGQRVVPTFAILGADLWRDFLLTPYQSVLEYFKASTGLEQGAFAGLTIVPAPVGDSNYTGKVVVGAKSAVTLFSLPGAPIRIDALRLAQGGVDGAIFNYIALGDAGKGVVRL